MPPYFRAKPMVLRGTAAPWRYAKRRRINSSEPELAAEDSSELRHG
jgi:hypothetical protein